MSLKRSSHLRDSFIVVAEQAVQSERLQGEICGNCARSCAVQTTTGGVACVGAGTSLSWNTCWLVDPSRLKGTSFPTPEDDRRGNESDASAVHGYAGRIGQAGRGIAE